MSGRAVIEDLTPELRERLERQRGIDPLTRSVLSEQARILEGDAFRRAPVQQKLLEYVIAKTLLGEACDLDEWHLAARG